MVTIELLKEEYYEIAASWMSDVRNNRWLASVWRGKKIQAKTIAVVMMKPQNILFLVRYNNAPCGIVGIACMDKIDKTCFIWAVLGDKQFANKGVMSEAFNQLSCMAFEEYKMRAAWAHVKANNIASIRMLEKAGYRKAGLLRKGFSDDGQHVDRLIYERLPEDL